MREKVLGLPVDVFSKVETVKIIEDMVKNPSKKLSLVVTAYSEFFVNASRDSKFAEIIKKAQLVTPDGISVLAAVEYNRKIQKLKISKTQNVVNTFLEGLKVGGKILKGDLGETVTGVFLFEELTKMASERGWKIFILGGWDNVSERATRMLLERHPGLRMLYDPGESAVGSKASENSRVVEKINKFKPDILFVQYRPVQQEKWIMENRGDLKVSVAIGIGGTLNEFVGDLKLAPAWMQAMGLKWLWRLWLEPKRWRRMVDAVIVFPWLVFRESLRG